MLNPEPEPLLTSRQVRRTTRRWVRRPAGPIRYRLVDRLVDIYHGWRDGVRGLPQVSQPDEYVDSAPEPVGTARLEVLRRLTAERIAAELLQAEADIAPLSVQVVTETKAHAAVAAEWLDTTRTRYKQVTEPPSDGWRSIRRLAEEERKRPEALVVARRLDEQRKRELTARHELQGAAERSQRLQQRLSAADAMAQARMEAARIRAERLYEHGWRRCATYWQHLVRNHPQGRVLNGRLRPVGPEMPDWMANGARRGIDPNGDGGR
jgi:hypothetical protein